MPAGKTKQVDGHCSCGHTGPQKRPDICGRCFRAENRGSQAFPSRDRTDEYQQRRADRIVKQFKLLNPSNQFYVLVQLGVNSPETK